MLDRILSEEDSYYVSLLQISTAQNTKNILDIPNNKNTYKDEILLGQKFQVLNLKNCETVKE